MSIWQRRGAAVNLPRDLSCERHVTIVIRNTVWLSVCRIAADLSGLVLFTVISRRYGPMGTGEYSYAFALGAFIAILATSGIEQYGVRQLACLKSPQEKSDCWQSLLVTQFIQLSIGL